MLPKMRIQRDDILQVLGKLVQGTTEQELCEGDPVAVFDQDITVMLQSLPSQPAHD